MVTKEEQFRLYCNINRISRNDILNKLLEAKSLCDALFMYTDNPDVQDRCYQSSRALKDLLYNDNNNDNLNVLLLPIDCPNDYRVAYLEQEDYISPVR